MMQQAAFNMPSFSRCLSHFFILSWLLILASYQVEGMRCHSSEDCDDSQDCTIDFCLGKERVCLNIKNASDTSCRAGEELTSKSAVISGTENANFPIAKKLDIISTAILLLRDIHPHRPFHRRFLGVDPVRSLLKFRKHVQRYPINAFGTNTKFHQKMIRIFQTIKDFHSIYITPRELRGTTALIPFSFREFFDDRKRRKFIVTDVGIGATFRNPLFKKGVEIVSWNGVPIDETVRKSGARSYGNNADSQLMAGIRKLTRRALFRDLLPESETVTVGFVAEGNRTESVTIPWIFIRMSSGVMAMVTMNGAQFPDQAANSTIRQLAGKMLLTNKGRISANGTVQNIPVRVDAALDIAGKIVTTSSGSFGIITFFGFSSTRSPGLLAAFDKLLLTQVPKNGVVIDVRQNEGGNVQLCQEVVPRFSTRFNIPVTLSLRVTRFLLEAARGVFGTVFGISRDDITRSRQFGNAFFFKQLFAQDQINSYTGPRYPGPVIVLTDAEAYSCGDIFVSNVKDNRAAFIVGIHNSTGGGGSTVRNTDQFRLSAFGFPIPQLHGVRMTTSFRRVDRARDQSGVPIEFFGITPNFLYRPTRRDRIEKDHDLYKFLADRLARLR